MRKSIITPDGGTPARINDNWRELERIARVEITSEDPAFPIEHALGKALASGWRAATTGPQVIRMHFDEPMTIRRIQLHFVERAAERTQEFVLLAGVGDGAARGGAAAVERSRRMGRRRSSRTTRWICMG